MSNTGLTPEEEALLSNMVYNNFDQDWSNAWIDPGFLC
jgi:hypothetical protein